MTDWLICLEKSGVEYGTDGGMGEVLVSVNLILAASLVPGHENSG